MDSVTQQRQVKYVFIVLQRSVIVKRHRSKVDLIRCQHMIGLVCNVQEYTATN